MRDYFFLGKIKRALKEAGKLIYPAFLSLFLRLILLCDVLSYFEWYIICFSKVVQ